MAAGLSRRAVDDLVALGALIPGFVERSDTSRPPWVAWLAWLAAGAGLVGVAFFSESSRGILAAVATLSAWQVATAALALWTRQPSAHLTRSP